MGALCDLGCFALFVCFFKYLEFSGSFIIEETCLFERSQPGQQIHKETVGMKRSVVCSWPILLLQRTLG